MGVNVVAGTGSAYSGTVVFSNSNGIQFGMQTTNNGSYVLTAAGAVAISAGTTLATTGTVSFANSNGLSFGLNGNTLTMSQGTIGYDFCNISYADSFANITHITAIFDIPFFVPFFLPYNFTFERFVWEASRAASNQDNHFSVSMAVYTIVNSTQISMIDSTSVSYAGTNRSAQSGIRRFMIDSIPTALTSLSSGQYVLGFAFDGTATASGNYSVRGAAGGSVAGFVLPGSNSYYSATNQMTSIGEQFFGRLSTTTASMPGTVGDSQLFHGASGTQDRVPMWFRIARTS